MSLLVMALEEELPSYYQASLSRVEVPEVSWHGWRDRVYAGSVRLELELYGFGGAQNFDRIMAQILDGTLEEGTDAASHLWEGIFLAVPLKTFNDLWFCFLAK